MTFRQRYKQLQDPAFVRRMVLRSVYGTMALENQTVPMERLEVLYDQVMTERENGVLGKFPKDEPSGGALPERAVTSVP